MLRLSLSNRPNYRSLIRIMTGVVLALLLYHLAINFATTDCTAIQSQLRDGGPRMLGRLLLAGTLAALLGFPASLIAVSLGILTGPFVGIPLTSISISLGSLVLWGIGRTAFKTKTLPQVLDRYLDRQTWFQNMMNQRPGTGYNWTAIQSLVAPIPYPIFGFITGARIRHLTIRSFLAGIFASSLLQSAGYSLAGSSIGCAVVNQALGYSIAPYRLLIVLSCLILVVLSRVQSILSEKS